MTRRRIRLVLALVFLPAACIVLAWAFWPLGDSTSILPLPPGSLSTPQPQPNAAPSLTEARTLFLDWPPVMRAGDSDLVRLTLAVDALGNIQPTAGHPGHLVTGETVYIPSVYDTYNLVAEARLDLAGAEVFPRDTSSQPLLPGQAVTFTWSVSPAEVGYYRGTVWFYLRFVPLDGSASSERAISAQTIEIEAVSFLGLKAGPARILGGVCALIGSALGIPFLEDGFRWLLIRRRRK